MTRIIQNLTLCCLTAEQRAKTCDYWYTITTRSTPYTAFRTRAALEFFLEIHDLTLSAPLPETLGTHAVIEITGDVRLVDHGSLETLPVTGRPVMHLSNGDHVTGYLVQEGGHPVLHYPGPNSDRQVHDHRLAREIVDNGQRDMRGLALA